MKPTLLVASLSFTMAATAAAGQDAELAAAPIAVPLPHAYSGYSQPDITDCHSSGPLERDCTVPAMTAGRYLIVGAAGATSTGADATQALSIKLGDAPCVQTRPVAFTGKKGLRLGCLVTLLSDQPLVVTVAYEVHDATANADGAKLVFRRLPWNGVVQSAAVAFQNATGQNAAAAPKK
jgi:hypothetical protein